MRAIFQIALLFITLLPVLAQAADKVPAKIEDEEECESRAVTVGGGSKGVMVVIGYMDDGTPILERQQITLNRQQRPLARHTGPAAAISSSASA